MRAVRLLVAASLSCGALLVLTPSVGASVPTASKACASLESLQGDLDDVDPTDEDSFDPDAFKDVGKAFRKASKTAPKGVKSALTTLGSFYEALGGSNDRADVLVELGKNSQKFTKAVTKFATYYSRACS